MRVLLTGCAGFIGWQVSHLLLEEGHSVVGLDNLNDAYDVRLKEWRLSCLKAEGGFTFHRLDIGDSLSLAPVFQQGSFDAVINLAARAGVRQSLEDPGGYWNTNVTGTLALLELCCEHGVKKFVLASSSSVYGDGDRPFTEGVSADRPLSPYAASKRSAELLCDAYNQSRGLDITALRYFTVYGPAGRPDMSVLRFTKWVSEGEPVVVYGDGFQERDFTYVADIARGTVAALRPMGYEVINLGSDRPVPLQDVVRLVEELTGEKANVQYCPASKGDVRATWANISKARSVLGWEPKVSLREGLRRTVEWYLENRSWARQVVP